MTQLTPPIIRYLNPRLLLVIGFFLALSGLNLAGLTHFSLFIFFVPFFCLLLILKMAQQKFRHISLNQCPYFSLDENQAMLTELNSKIISLNSQRTFDFCLALVLIPLLSPFIFILSFEFLLKKQSPFFIQNRHGFKGRIFRIIKLKTICDQTGQVSVLGRGLRKSGLDEIPQLWNILCGEMSFAGPRPEILDKMQEQSPIVQIRLAVRPGLTGYWQLSPFRNEAIEAHLEYDLAYVLTRNIWIDCLLILLTPFCAGPKNPVNQKD